MMCCLGFLLTRVCVAILLDNLLGQALKLWVNKQRDNISGTAEEGCLDYVTWKIIGANMRGLRGNGSRGVLRVWHARKWSAKGVIVFTYMVGSQGSKHRDSEAQPDQAWERKEEAKRRQERFRYVKRWRLWCPAGINIGGTTAFCWVPKPLSLLSILSEVHPEYDVATGSMGLSKSIWEKQCCCLNNHNCVRLSVCGIGSWKLWSGR